MEKLGIQHSLDLDTPKSSEIEKRIEHLLEWFRVAPAEIRRLEKNASGEGLLIMPSVTANKRPDEDDLDVLWRLQTETWTDVQNDTINTLSRYLDPAAFTYATRQRVADRLADTFADTKDENEILQAVYTLLRETQGDESVPMTATERLAAARAPHIAKARFKLPIVKERYESIKQTLEEMKEYFYDEYLLLYNRYVLKHALYRVQCELGENGIPKTHDEYYLIRTKAMKHFREHSSIVMTDDCEG